MMIRMGRMMRMMVLMRKVRMVRMVMVRMIMLMILVTMRIIVMEVMMKVMCCCCRQQDGSVRSLHRGLQVRGECQKASQTSCDDVISCLSEAKQRCVCFRCVRVLSTVNGSAA